MNLLDTLAARLGYAKATGKPAPAQLLSMADGYRWEMPDASEAEKQIRLYQQLTWFSTAIDNTANIAATGVFGVRQVAGEPGGADDKDLPNHEFEKLLRRPNPSQSRGEFLRDSFTTYKITGNLFWFLNRPNENVAPSELWIVPSHMLRPIPDGRSYIKGYEFTPSGRAPEFIPPWKIMHLKTANPLNPFVGLSALQSLAIDAYGDLAQQKFNLSMFDANAGKMPGIIVFNDMVADPMWKEIKRARETEWGKGAKHAGPMMLRGVGANGVDYIAAQLSQREMEFLEGRGFTRSEIYGKLAPGLDSILAVNATEANAIAGKATLIEFGVWPVLVQLAEKITSDLLPLYGENLEGAFDDMRQTNRILDLQEQQEYAKYHTVNEVRAEYYDEGPLMLDESQAAALEEDMAQETENRETALAQVADAKPAANKPPAFGKAEALPAEGKPSKQLDPRGLMFVAQIGPATPLPGDPTAPPPAAPTPPPLMQPEGDAVPDKESPDDGQEQEMKAWERFAVKRLGRGREAREFEPRVLPLLQAARIQAALKTARTEADVRAVFAGEKAPPGDLARLAAAIEAVEKKL
jgi:phage portal protein BeeE